MTIEEIRKILPTLPESPGCYKYIGEAGNIIYVGKAKNLRRRVSSYFQKDQQSAKTRLLVRQIRGIEYVVVNSEAEALILENALIKENQPRYNILLKDDKTYPEVVIRNEPFPRVRVERRPKQDGSQRFGPYPSAGMAHAAVDMVRDLYPIRICDLDLSPAKIAQGKYKVCLQYHIKKCKAPCIGLQTEEDYQRNIREATKLLRGDLQEVIDLYREEMMRLSEELRFEEAQIYKERLQYLENYQVKHTVAPHHIHNVDVFSFDQDEDGATYVNFMHLTQGMVTQVYTLEYRSQMEDETKEELFASAITELRRRFASRAKEIILPFNPEWKSDPSITITIPQRGDKKRLLELSERNVRQYKVDKYKRTERLNPDQRLMEILTELRQTLKLPTLPMHIESFDNSNIQGSDPVAACVVFKRGRPSKKDYRKYNIHSVEGPDDYASMREIITRRYRKKEGEEQHLPDLILADGGKGQVSAIREALSDLGLFIPVAGMVKDDRHRTSALLYGEGTLREIPIRHRSPTFHLLEQIQNEVHRFAITFHRDKRSKSQLSSRLDYIPGIGPKTKETLLASFHSVTRITEASFEELTQTIGPAKAKTIFEAFHAERITADKETTTKQKRNQPKQQEL